MNKKDSWGTEGGMVMNDRGNDYFQIRIGFSMIIDSQYVCWPRVGRFDSKVSLDTGVVLRELPEFR